MEVILVDEKKHLVSTMEVIAAVTLGCRIPGNC